MISRENPLNSNNIPSAKLRVMNFSARLLNNLTHEELGIIIRQLDPNVKEMMLIHLSPQIKKTQITQGEISDLLEGLDLID